MTEFWNARAPAWIVGAAVLLSFLGHYAALLIAGTLDIVMHIEPQPLTEVELLPPQEPPPPAPDVEEPDPEAPAAEEIELPEPKPKPPKARPEPEPEPEAEQAPPEDEPAPLEETVADFSNMTLTNEGSSSWGIQPSSGKESDGPIAGPGTNTGRKREGSLTGAPDGKGTEPAIALKDLGRKPEQAPGLDGLVEKHYPQTLKRQGVEGVARVRIRISSDGKLRVLRVLSATDPAFGEACKRSLRESPPWRPALDKRGQPAITEAPFKCEYIVR